MSKTCVSLSRQKKRLGTLACCAIVGGMLAMPGLAAAAPPVVKTVPWVATNPLIPHDTWTGKSITLKGTSDVQGANIHYTWDFGDGSPVATGTVSDNSAIQALHGYTGAVGTIFTATLTVQNTSTGETGSATYLVEIRNQTLDVEVNVAIDEGLWFLHKQMYRYDSGGSPFGDMRNNGYAGNYYGLTAAAVNAFEINGHVESLAGDSDPYKDTVARGLHFVFSGLVTQNIGPTGLGNPEDYNGDGVADPGSNGLGIIVNQGSWYYQHGMVADAIIASGTPAAVAVTGPANVIGRTYGAIVQDMVDYASYGQYADPTYGGGWYYSFGGWGDNSICQWVAIALIPAERNGWAKIPPFVKAKNPNWLVYSQSSAGYFGYQSSGPIWGPYAVTPSGMVQMAMDGIGRGDNGAPAPGKPSWDKAEKYIRDNFSLDTGDWSNSVKEYYYGLLSFVKSMRLQQPPIVQLRDYTGAKAPIDWYNAEKSKGAEAEGVARTLVTDQDQSAGSTRGRWVSASYPTGEQAGFHTEWAIMMLSQSLFEAGSPVAVATAVPNPAVAGQTVNLSGAASFHQDSTKSIVKWEWDLNNNGVYNEPGIDVSGVTTTVSYPVVGNYPVRLRVTDNGSPVKTAETTLTIVVSTPPIAPTADAGGPYVFCPGAKPWYLDGSASINPDNGGHQPGAYPGDFIKSYAWELNGDGNFTDAAGVQPDVTAYFTGLGVGSYLVQLKVTDNTALSYPSSGMGDLWDTDSAQVTVKAATDPACQCINSLAARPKDSKVQLTWTNNGAVSYHVYRGTANGGPYLHIGDTTSTYSTYLDQTVVNGTTYYYVVRPAALNGDELCQSNQASAKPTKR